MKKFMCLAMTAAMLAMSLTACGSSDSAEETTAAAAAAEAEDSTEAGDTASSDAVFVIGGTGPLTGSAAIYGNAVKNGGQIAVDEINAAGGINGYQVKWIFEDDEADTEKAINAYNTLKDQDLQMFVGTTTSGSCLAVVPETENDNMFQQRLSGRKLATVQGTFHA